MGNNKLLSVLLLVGLTGSTAAYAGIGDFTGTSTPTVITPPTTPAPQTPAYPTPPVGSDQGFFFAPGPRASMRTNSPAPVAPPVKIR
jgi:hypothetical protein